MADAPASSEGLVLERHLDRLQDLTGWLEAVALRHDLSPACLFSLDLVLTEAVTNIIDYGGSGGPDGRIHLTLQVVGDAVAVELADDGLAYDPTLQPPPAQPTSLAEATIGGLGVHLMRQYSRHMDYARQDGRNVLRLVLPLTPEPR